MFVLVSKENAKEIVRVLKSKGYDDAVVNVVEEKQDYIKAIEEASRVPTKILILDIDIGSNLGTAVLRYRLKRPDTRIIVYAKDGKPGDSEIASIVQAGVYDIAVDISDLEKIIDSDPYGIDRAVKWLDPSFSPELETSQESKRSETVVREKEVVKEVVKEVIVEKKVPLSSRPVLIAVAGTAPGVGTTATALTLASFLASKKYKTVYIELEEPSIEDITGMEVNEEPKRFRPYFDVSKKGDYKAIERSRKYQYIILDLGARSQEELLGIDADLYLAVLPCFHRLERASLWLNCLSKIKYIAGDEITSLGWRQSLASFSKYKNVDIITLPYCKRFPNSLQKTEAFIEILSSVLPV